MSCMCQTFWCTLIGKDLIATQSAYRHTIARTGISNSQNKAHSSTLTPSGLPKMISLENMRSK